MIYIATRSALWSAPRRDARAGHRPERPLPPIGGLAGRRTAEDDERMERELRASEKEAAEHLMLIDLGRNDLGRVCATGAYASPAHEVERYRT